MKSLKLLAAVTALMFAGTAGAAGAAQAGEQRILEVVVVTAKAPPRPEFVIVVAEMPTERKTVHAVDAGEAFEIVLAVERPHLDASVTGEALAPQPLLTL